MMLGVIAVEHVLANGLDLRSIAAYRGASVMYDAWASQYHLIGLTMASEEIARWWLRRERMPRWARILAADVLANEMSLLEYQEWKIMQVRNFLSEGWEIAFYLDSHDGPIMQVHEIGVTTLTYEHATINPGWRDPALAAPRAWEDLAVSFDKGGDGHGPG